MQQQQRNNKHNQQELQRARETAQQAVIELHEMLSRRDRSAQRVGQTISLAARLGLLNSRNVG